MEVGRITAVFNLAFTEPAHGIVHVQIPTSDIPIKSKMRPYLSFKLGRRWVNFLVHTSLSVWAAKVCRNAYYKLTTAISGEWRICVLHLEETSWKAFVSAFMKISIF